MSDYTVTIDQRYRSLVESINAGYCLIRIEFDDRGTAVDYRFCETNALFEAHTGLQNAVGHSARELVPGLEGFWIDRYAEVDATRAPIHFEQRSEAMKRFYDVHAFPVGPSAGHLVGLLFNDISQQRAREESLKFLADVASVFESDAPLSDIMTSIGARLGDFTSTNSCLFCELDEANDTITTSYGWTRAGEPNLVRTFKTSAYLSEEFLAEGRARRTIAIADTAGDARTDAQAYAALNVGSFVIVPFFTDGKWSHYFAVTDAKPRQWTGEELELLNSFARLVFSKLERARADAALRDSEARFRAMADAVPQIIWIIDASGKVEFFNRQWSAYTGIPFVPETATDVAGEVIHPDDAADVMSRFQASVESGDPMMTEHRIRSASGEHRWFLVRAVPDRDPDTGLVRRLYGASVDIHDRRMIEQELAETDRRKDEFLATLAHELRNPLAPIRTGLNFLEMDPPAATAARTREVMGRQLSHMVRLIDDLLDIARINSNKIRLRREPLDLRSVVEEAIEAHRPVIDQAGHRLFASMPSERIGIEGDRTRLVQVVGNLLSNAGKYTPHGGRIDVSVETADGRALVRVADTGVGIEPESLEDVFTMFSQVARHAAHSQGGLGIGLALVRRLVEMHGGTVSGESPGRNAGSTFSLSLPMSEDALVPAAREPGVFASQQALRIVVLDDNIDAADMLGSVLDLAGHSVRLAHSGPDALELMHADPPDVAFLDIGMPGMDGYEVGRRLRAGPLGRTVRLIALTGWGSEADRVLAFESGFDHHLTKPVDVQSLFSALAEVGGDGHAGRDRRG